MHLMHFGLNWYNPLLIFKFCVLVLVCVSVCVYARQLMGKSPGVLRNQNVYPMTSNAGNNKPAQWLTDPYFNS